MTLKLLDLFSGIGGFSYAAEHIVGGFQTVQFVECEPFCQKILKQHWPDAPIHDDITTFNPSHGSADVVCGGFPCQDISNAGKQLGIKQGTRSGLFYELMRVVRMVGPQYVVLENVAAITSNGLDVVLGTLAEAGFDAEWACIPASAVGACHQRDRWWLVAYPQGSRTRQHKSHARRQFERGFISAPGNSNQKASITANANDAGMESAKPEQQTAGTEQHGEPDTPHSGSTRLERSQHTQWRIAQQLCSDWGGYLSKPVLRRGDDGLSDRVDRLKALGNAVVPQVAAIPLKRVIDLSTPVSPNSQTSDER